jgi:hypothetical protein
MDSEDEYISDASSQEEEDFDGTQDSEAGSVGDGKSDFPLTVVNQRLPWSQQTE